MWSVKNLPKPGLARISARRASGAGAGFGVTLNSRLPTVVMGGRLLGAPAPGAESDAVGAVRRKDIAASFGRRRSRGGVTAGLAAYPATRAAMASPIWEVLRGLVPRDDRSAST